MSSAFIGNAFHPQLPGGEVNVFDLERFLTSARLLVACINSTYHVIGYFQLCCICIVNENVETFSCNISIQSVAWNVSIIACVLKKKEKIIS